MKKRPANEWLLLLAGVLVFLLFVVHYFDPSLNPFGIGSDAYEFWHLAQNLKQHHQFAYTDISHYPLINFSDAARALFQGQVIPCTARVPGYPFLLAILLQVYDAPGTAIFLNLLMYSGICLYGFALGRTFFTPQGIPYWIYCVLLTFSPLYFVRFGVGADIPAAFFATAFSYHALRLTEPSSRPGLHAILTTGFGLLANLTRANLFILTMSVLLGLLCWSFIKHQKRILTTFGIILLTIIIGMECWMIRHKNLTGQAGLSSQAGYVLFTVHLGYHLKETHPLAYWKWAGKEELFLENLRQGRSFNQAEEAINEQLRSLVRGYYGINPWRFIHNAVDCLKTFFMFSYFDIADAIIYMKRPWPERVRFVHASSSENLPLNRTDDEIRQLLFQNSRWYKMLIAVSFFAFPFLFLIKSAEFKNKHLWTILYLATLAGVLTTAVMTGAGGDRLRMPFNAFILIFVVGFLTQFKIAREKGRNLAEKFPHGKLNVQQNENTLRL